MTIYRLEDAAPDLPEPSSFWIAPSATVAGRVRIDRAVGIWFGAVLRGDDEALEVGERTNVQDNAVLHADPGFLLRIGRGCTIGHGAIVHGCTIGDNTLVGLGATVMNGARIDANCGIGANALITEGKMFANNSLITGAPAKALRELAAAAVAGLQRSVDAYVRTWRRYAAGAALVAG